MRIESRSLNNLAAPSAKARNPYSGDGFQTAQPSALAANDNDFSGSHFKSALIPALCSSVALLNEYDPLSPAVAPSPIVLAASTRTFTADDEQVTPRRGGGSR